VFAKRFEVAELPQLPENRALPLLWARTRIAELSGYGVGTPGDDARGEILALGLRHRLLTPYTSFVAVSKLVRNTREPGKDVTQPLPLPEGVSNAAVGVGPEPELIWLAAPLALAVALRHMRRVRRRARAQACAA
jgi:Ca-activated chloride channel family protein